MLENNPSSEIVNKPSGDIGHAQTPLGTDGAPQGLTNVLREVQMLAMQKQHAA
jgi:hypothetical protein